ncbi:MAG: hypothetical protein QOH68_2263 [Nocardioidaceae bacterium]|jgi:PST family polysaccharide transporter|nr:hypothetical protein [Nocardioidaceae bacterium]
MEDKAAGGVRWTILTYAVSKVITFAATAVLARLLVPADFGVVMLGFVAMNVIGIFGDLGLGATLVVRQDLDRPALGTVLTLLVASGTALAGLLVLTAPVLSRMFREPRLGGVLVALAPLTVMGSFNWFYQWLLQRDLEFKRRFIGVAVQTLAYASVSVSVAVLHAGVWSIVAGHLAGQGAMAVAHVVMVGFVPPSFDRPLARDLLRTSRSFLLQSADRLLGGSADYLAIGRVLGAAPLGLYSMAFRLSELLHLAIADPVAKVTFPMFARMRHRGEAVADRYLEVLRLIATLTLPMGALLSAAAVPFTRAVYGPKWLGMTTALSILAVWGAFQCVETTLEWLLNSVGGQGRVALVAVVVLVVEVPSLFLAADRGGIAGAAWVILGATVVSLLALVFAVKASIDVGVTAHVGAVVPPLLASGAAWVVARVAAQVVGGEGLIVLVVAVVAGGAAYLVALAVLAPQALVGTIRQVRAVVRGGVGPDEPAAAPPPTPWEPGGGDGP